MTCPTPAYCALNGCTASACTPMYTAKEYPTYQAMLNDRNPPREGDRAMIKDDQK